MFFEEAHDDGYFNYKNYIFITVTHIAADGNVFNSVFNSIRFILELLIVCFV